MAVLRSFLPRLGLFLCLSLYFPSAVSASYDAHCMVFDEVFTSSNSEITIKREVVSEDSVYTVSVPVNNEVSSVVVQAVNQDNNSVGTWDGASEECNGTALYNVTQSSSSIFSIRWRVPSSEDISNTNLQIFVVDSNHTAAFSSVKVEQNITPTAFTPTSEISGTSQTTNNPTAKTTEETTGKTSTMATAKTTEETTGKTTTMATGKTTEETTGKTTTMATGKTTTLATSKTTTKATGKTTASTMATTTATGLAVRAFSSPIAGAIHILFVFLTSKLLF